MNRITLRSQDEATGLVCPFLSRSGIGVVNCITVKCMFWVQFNMNEIPLKLEVDLKLDKSKEYGYCGVG